MLSPGTYPQQSDEAQRYLNCTLRNGVVYTGGATPRCVDCVVVRGGRVAWVGAYSDCPDAFRDHETIDLRGRMVVPSFTDSHAHPVEGFQLTCDADLGAADSFEAIAQAVRRCASERPERSWVMAGNVSLEAMGSKLHREALDTLVADRPLMLIGHDVHSGCVNSAALRALGVDAATPDPEGGIYERDAHGQPTGVIHEAALYSMFRHLPQMNPAESVQALRKAQQQAHRFGITGWFEAMAGQRLVDVYASARDAGELKANVSLGLLVSPNLPLGSQIDKLCEWRAAYHGGRLRLHTAKFFIDGVIESHTGALLEPYADVVHSGNAHWTPRQLREAVFTADAEGFDLHFHTIGDRAVRMALDVLAALKSERPGRERRPQLAHVQMIDEADVARFAQVGAIASVQGVWADVSPDLQALYRQRVGNARIARHYVFGDLVRAGTRLSGGSDWPVSTQNPLVAMEHAVRRACAGQPDAPVFLPEQRVNLDVMMQAYTHHAAFSLRFDDQAGYIAPGRPASLAVLSQDLRAVESHRLAQAEVELTLFEGEAVYGGLD
ncbi:amidohydrolase [Paraburkholderia haematera]|uniref:N-substituted formamide deformylase n=1 Tax=Paraburkholderia haematera TaxID=2793077 RepID=A0ABM8SB52_9BURK|nr:amidohydrolase [Paraburkholderia haematera]CAE6798693.1 N-substituted formamide deformylase [Paraburkholderia haematera]